jgi:cytochrome c5
MKLTSVLPASALVVLLTACGPQAPATPDTAASAPTTAADATPAPVTKASADAGTSAGQATYNRTCALCHAMGTAGAPKPGDSADWEPRRAQGMDVLYKHALEGFSGSKGVMPARGGAANLTDDEVKAAADFMLSVSG